MATKRAKTEKIDAHPTRVQNPYEHLKRSPGKFDQRVFMEQELCSTNNIRFYNHLYSTQERAQLNRFDKSISELKKRSTELREKNEEYSYLRSLRSTLNQEMKRRQSGAQTARPVTSEEERRRRRILQRSTAAALDRKKKAEAALVQNAEGQTAKNDEAGQSQQTVNIEQAVSASATVMENVLDDKLAGNFASITVSQGEAAAQEDDRESESETGSIKPQKTKAPPPRRCAVSPSRLTTLESLSYEIMTNTLPIQKMKRILTDNQVSVQDSWPILSNYRKQTVLPSVKRGKQRLSHEMGDLHTRINDYFNCDNFPLWQYKYIPKQKPQKYRLLEAIKTEPISFPTLPKHEDDV